MYNSGERLIDKIEFEELALRGVDLALGSNLWWGAETEKMEALETGSMVSLLFCFLSDPDPMHPDLLRSGLKDFSSDVEIRRRTAYIFSSTYSLSCTLDIVYIRSNTFGVVI